LNRPYSQGISLVIPIYNEEGNIAKSVSEAVPVLASLTQDYEIIFVESGSTDNSAAILNGFATENERIKVIHQGAKLGLGSALKQGFDAARYEYIFYIDGDNPFPMSDFIRGFPLLQQADIVCGYRVNRRDTPIRYIYSKVFNLLIRTLFQVKVRDVQIGFKMLRKSIFEKVKLNSDGMFIDAELLIKAQNEGYRITEFGVRYLGRASGKSSVTLWEVLKIAGDLLKYKFRKNDTGAVTQAPDYHFQAYFSRRYLAHIIHKKRFDIVVSLVPRKSFVLDAGCGSGIVLFLLAARKACTGVGIDIRKESVEFASRQVPAFKFYEGDVQEFSLPYKFDVVICLEVLEHFTPPSQVKIIDKLDAHLKDGGLLIVESPSNFYFLIEPMWKLLRKLLHPLTVFCDEEYHRSIPWGELADTLRQRGYTVEHPRLSALHLIKYIVARKR